MHHGSSGRRIRARRCCTATGCARSGSTALTSTPTCRRKSSRRSSAGCKRNGYAGGNITIPHKEAAFRLVDRRERAADAIGAVNTVWYEGDTLVGGNTDWYGIVASLDDIHPGWDASPGKALVLGAGGSARASVFAFLERKFSVAIVNRTRERAEKLAAQFGPRVSVHDWSEVPELLGRSRRADQQHLARHGRQAAARDRSRAAEDIRDRL